MAFKVLSDNLDTASQKAEDYVQNMAEYYKLRLFKSTAKGAISLINILLVGVISLLALLFVSLGVALWLSEILDSRYWGYFIVAGIYVVLLILQKTVLKEGIKKTVLMKFSDIFFENEEEEEVENKPAVFMADDDLKETE